MDVIEAWLHGKRDYATGVRLYMQHGTDPAFKKLFTTEAETPFKKQKLFKLLQQISQGSNSPEETSQIIGDAQNQSNPSKSWRKTDNKDSVELGLWEKYRLTHKQLDDLHSQLLLFNNDDDRKEAAFRILRLDEELDEIIATRDHYRKEGKLPNTAATEIITDPFLMANRINCLKRYIRREKQAVAKDAGNVKAAARLKDNIDELNIYLRKLNQPEYELGKTTD